MASWLVRAASVAAAFALGACSSAHGLAARGLPPLWEHESGLPGDLHEDRAFFGFASRTQGPDGALLSAVRPFLAQVERVEGNRKLHVVPPIGSHLVNPGYGIETTIYPCFFDSSFGDAKDVAEMKTDDDTAVLPLFLWGDDPNEGAYFALFPLGGTVKGKLLADRIDFVLFPLYAHTQADQWRSTHLLWPLIAWGESPTRSHFRVMPLWSQTDSETQHKRTLLWPVGHWGTERRGDRIFDSWFVLPLVGHRGSRDGQFSEWTALWPFFEISHDDKTGDSSVAAPWPFFKHFKKTGESESTWFWPAYGRYDSESEHSAFYAWPIVWTSDVTAGSREFRQTYVVPVWMRHTAGPKGGAPDDDELRSWPLFDWRRRGDGVETLRIPEIIPFFGWEAGETCYADLLTLFKWRADGQGRAAWDLPLSIVRWRRTAKGARTLTLLWWIDVPLGGGS